MNKSPSAATVNWAVFISTGTEIAFQIPHNLFPSLLHAHKGGVLEYPFASYALADSRWAEYNGGTGLLREVCVHAWPGSGCAPSRCRCSSDINWNDGALGLAVAAAYLYRSSFCTLPSTFAAQTMKASLRSSLVLELRPRSYI